MVQVCEACGILSLLKSRDNWFSWTGCSFSLAVVSSYSTLDKRQHKYSSLLLLSIENRSVLQNITRDQGMRQRSSGPTLCANLWSM